MSLVLLKEYITMHGHLNIKTGKVVPVLNSSPHHEVTRGSEDITPRNPNSQLGCFTSGN
jgi:hypothetical protein